MAKKILAYNTGLINSGPPLAAQAATLVKGVFVGLDSSGNVKLADYLASAGPVVARGVLLADVQMKDPRGNVIDTNPRVSYVEECRIDGFSSLTPGATYFLSSGGGITATKPAGTTSDIDQEVGFAETDSILISRIGPKVVHA